ncbi:MAG: cephalosporin hydroxylase [Chloroflexi bacterium]|nr:MAG: cephalosporin hydroxylase [Chloroflexota bacterium]
MSAFDDEVRERIEANGRNGPLREAARSFMRESTEPKYSYNFAWLGRPIIQYPQDIVAMQELIWAVQPDLVIETGIAHGGSLILWASLLELNAACGGPADAGVIGVDIEIRPANRDAIEGHPMHRRITMIEGSSVDPVVRSQVEGAAAGRERVLVCLDSNHTHAHVLAELEAYAPLASIGSYCVVFDTVIEDLPADAHPDRPWGPGDNPKTAVLEFLRSHAEFEVDRAIEDKLLITVAPGGYLRRIR